MKKAQSFGIVILFVLFILVIIFIGSSLNLWSLVGIGKDYTLNTEDLSITFFTSETYWDIVGCKKTPNIGACSVRFVNVGTEGSCQLTKAYATGFYSCDSVGFANNCEYGNNCDPYSGYGKDWCSKHCTWGEKTLPSIYGGSIYQDFDNCAWYVVVRDKQGNFIKEFSQATKNTAWDTNKEKYYRDPVSFRYENTYFNYVSDDYEIVQRRDDGSTVKGCRAINFKAEDERHIYDVCIGNDNIDEPLCKDVLTKTCKLTCSLGKQLDVDSCSCVDASEITPPIGDYEDITPKCNLSCLFNKFISWLKSLFS